MNFSCAGWTALHHAAMAGHKSAVQLLVKRGASVNAVTANGLTPLQVAVEHHNLSCARILRIHMCTLSAGQLGAVHDRTTTAAEISDDDGRQRASPWYECTMEALCR